MKIVTVSLNDISKIQKFNNVVTKFESDIDLVKGRYVVSAKSIMGIYSLDLSESINVIIHSENEEEVERFIEVMKEFE